MAKFEFLFFGVVFLALATLIPVQTQGQTVTIGAGAGVASGKSKIDKFLPDQTAIIYSLTGSVTGKKSFVNASLVKGPDDPGGRTFEFNNLGGGLNIKAVSLGIETNYFYSSEHEPMIREVGFLVDSLTKKHYLTFGLDALCGNANSRHIRGSYSVGGAYIWQDGVFMYKNSNQTITKLYNKDTQPIDMIRVSGAWTRLWKIDVSGSISRVKTREFLGKANPQKFIPPDHTVTNLAVASPFYPLPKLAVLSVEATFINNNMGMAFLGNSLTAHIKLRF